ncbi:divalent-cation tolerance protein CutA [Chenggangzhangella methanolivorans]|uniref:Divalent-cation tolerance protein CutA n=1 Tax=Chenggangzhangella methanolivorans TaxID=1437009 RepID=A0A9E6UJQ9_9HYPH|nr:divalent-cation tolerance protein CutA [Chenggangzhangella methanolivorans]QZN98381.1 divalent-cation tolerance protein CutA [Chenggangzhangella methanolivorans]
MAEFCTVTTTTDDRAAAERIARAAVERRLGACARIYPATSLYRWKGAIETAEETVLEIKTTAARRDGLEALILELHPYELPEIVVHPIVDGSEAYLAWLSEETGAGSG